MDGSSFLYSYKLITGVLLLIWIILTFLGDLVILVVLKFVGGLVSTSLPIGVINYFSLSPHQSHYFSSVHKYNRSIPALSRIIVRRGKNSFAITKNEIEDNV